eukprot:COSAG01_NODE_24751_length_767_cov_14.423653_3_plen_46_part_01
MTWYEREQMQIGPLALIAPATAACSPEPPLSTRLLPAQSTWQYAIV